MMKDCVLLLLLFCSFLRNGSTFRRGLLHISPKLVKATPATITSSSSLPIQRKYTLRNPACARSTLLHGGSATSLLDIENIDRKPILATSFDDLIHLMNGKGKAKMIWEDLREGINPLYGKKLSTRAKVLLSWLILSSPTQQITSSKSEERTELAKQALALFYTPNLPEIDVSVATSSVEGTVDQKNDTQSLSRIECDDSDNTVKVEEDIQQSQEQSIQQLQQQVLQAASKEFIPISLLKETVSSCGTRKMLLQLTQDDLEIESVLIPSTRYDRTTLCVSTQVGCDRGCAFCLTGKMGLIRNLTVSEIIGQVICGLEVSRRESMPSMTNIVFMGMGDAGRNLDAVKEAVACLTDHDRLSFAHQKVTVSTVGPNPHIFKEIAHMNCTIAWSLHSPNETIRQQLVYSSRSKGHASVLELRQGLLDALQTSNRTRRKQTLMLALTLIDGINDSEQDALQVAEFVKPMLDVCHKIAIDLIPYNEIPQMKGIFQRPSRERVNAFQRILRDQGLFCSVRVTRGDEESSACGMLATKKRPPRKVRQISVGISNVE